MCAYLLNWNTIESFCFVKIAIHAIFRCYHCPKRGHQFWCSRTHINKNRRICFYNNTISRKPKKDKERQGKKKNEINNKNNESFFSALIASAWIMLALVNIWLRKIEKNADYLYQNETKQRKYNEFQLLIEWRRYIVLVFIELIAKNQRQ